MSILNRMKSLLGETATDPARETFELWVISSDHKITKQRIRGRAAAVAEWQRLADEANAQYQYGSAAQMFSNEKVPFSVSLYHKKRLVAGWGRSNGNQQPGQWVRPSGKYASS